MHRAGERSHPTSEVRGRSRDDPTPEGRRPRGATPRAPGCDSAGAAERSYPTSEAGVVARRSYPTPEARGSGREEQPHIQGAVAAQAQEGPGAIAGSRSGGAVVRRYPLSKVRSSICALLEQPRRDTPHPR